MLGSFNVLLVHWVMMMTSTAASPGGAALAPALVQGRTPVSIRRPIPIARKPLSPMNRIPQGANRPKSKKVSTIKGVSKYIWYSSEPFPSELRNQVIGNLSIPVSPMKKKNATSNTRKNEAKARYYYFLSDLTKDQISRYNASIAKNSKMSAQWDHRDHISKQSFYHRNRRQMGLSVTTAMDPVFSSSTAAPNVTMYIIDSGVSIGHPEFANNDPVSYNFSPDEDDEMDCTGHGTHVASLALGEEYGIARNAKLVSLKVLDCEGSTYTQFIIEAIRHAMDEALAIMISSLEVGGNPLPSIINLSLGGDPNEALDDILTIAGQQYGLYIVTSAGNNNEDACLDSIAKSPYTITVAATNVLDQRRRTSNYGPCVDLYAPGDDLLAAVPYYLRASGTDLRSGTSMASPVAAGTLAVYLSKFGVEEGYRHFQEQLVEDVVKNNPPNTPNRFVHLNMALLS